MRRISFKVLFNSLKSIVDPEEWHRVKHFSTSRLHIVA